MKRINPDTNELFKKRDSRPSTEKQDGKLFDKYRASEIKKDGYCVEVWVNPSKFDSSKGVKRLNPDTGKPFERHYIREDGMRFMSYQKTVNSDGYFAEQWYTPEAYENYVKAKDNYGASPPDEKTKKRLNPKTGKEFEFGDQNEKGQYFLRYHGHRRYKEKNFYHEEWIDDLLDYKCREAFYNCSARAKRRNLKFNLTQEYLKEIFPKDDKCPILDIDISRKSGANADDSPSLDRMIPSKGYVKGNVIWISNRANRIKSDSTVEELIKIGNFYEELFKKKGTPA